MTAEFWAIIGVGVTLLVLGSTVMLVGWQMFNTLRGDIQDLRGYVESIDRRLARLEGRQEGATP